MAIEMERWDLPLWKAFHNGKVRRFWKATPGRTSGHRPDRFPSEKVVILNIMIKLRNQ